MRPAARRPSLAAAAWRPGAVWATARPLRPLPRRPTYQPALAPARPAVVTLPQPQPAAQPAAPQQQQQQQASLQRQQQQQQTQFQETPLSAEALWLVLLSTAVAFICSIDRAAMSVTILPMSEQFQWDAAVKGAVSSAFFAGYTVRGGSVLYAGVRARVNIFGLCTQGRQLL